MHFDFPKTPVLPKSTYVTTNQLACQKAPGLPKITSPPKSTWPAKKHQVRQKAPGPPKSTRPAKMHWAAKMKDIDSSTCPTGHPGAAQGHPGADGPQRGDISALVPAQGLGHHFYGSKKLLSNDSVSELAKCWMLKS